MARWELIQRIEHRDNTLLLFLGAVGAIFGAVSTDLLEEKSLLMIPYLSLGITIMIEHHNKMIGLLGYYLKTELEPYYRKINEYAPQWDGSRSLVYKSTKAPSILKRKYAHIALITVPSAFGLATNLDWLWNLMQNCEYRALVDSWLPSVWLLGLGALLSSVYCIWISDRFRNSLYEDYRQRDDLESESGFVDSDPESDEGCERQPKKYGFLGLFWHRD
jgi:hypothetical protein